MLWCLGMFSSASTWTFNVAQKLAASITPAKPVTPLFIDLDDVLPPDFDAEEGTLVVKTHGTRVGRELSRRAAAIIVTIRDPRDAVASLMRHNKAPFDTALRMTELSASTCAKYIMPRKSIVLRFEDRFFENPATITRIAAKLPGTLGEADSARIFNEMQRDAVDAFIAELETLPTTRHQIYEATGQSDTFDTVTGWHKHHAGRTGEIGRWRHDLSDAQVSTITRVMRPWMERFGYHPITPRRVPYLLTVGHFEVLNNTGTQDNAVARVE
jgi:hypothetical protein